MPGHSGMHLDGGGRGVSRGCQRRRRRRKRLGAAAGGGASGMSQWRGWAASRFRRKRVAVVRHRFHRRLATACFDRAKERQRERGDRRCATRGSHRSRVRFAGHPRAAGSDWRSRRPKPDCQPDSGVNGQFFLAGRSSIIGASNAAYAVAEAADLAAQVAPSPNAARDAARAERAEQHRAAQAAAAARCHRRSHRCTG